MDNRTEQILLDFIAVYLNDKAGRSDEYVKEELSRLTAACEVNGTELIDCNYDD